MSSPDQRQFAIVKFQQNCILLLHKPSKQVYRYQPAPADISHLPHISHHALLRPITYNNGFLYPQGKSTLQIELDQRKRAHQPIPFSEDQILNTMKPIVDCLSYLHEQGIVHGGVTPANIIISHKQEIHLNDWLVEKQQNMYYPRQTQKNLTKEDDWIAFGQILAQVATLKKTSKIFLQKQINHVVENIIDKYSKGFIFAICVLLKKNKERFSNLLNYLNNDPKFMGDLELSSLYDSLKKQKQRKKIAAIPNQNVNVMSNTTPYKPLCLSLHDSPVKKGNNGSLGSTLRKVKEQGENRGRAEDLKKKQIDKINKIIERSNQFVSELMARKNNEQILKKIAPKPNIANISMYTQTHKKTIKEGILGGSPNKKIRTISRKK